ncbi:MAG: SCO family protein [Pseudomonadota bacterium]
MSIRLVISGVALACSMALAAAASETAPRVHLGGPFALTDQHGTVRHDTDFRGHYMLVYFGYNWCPDVCPMSLYNITAALEQLGDQATKVQPIYVTIDPERDTVEEMKAYAEHFHPSLVALTGTLAQTEAVAEAYGVRYERVGEGADDYYVDHTALIYLMDPAGSFVRFFSHEAMAAEIALGLKEAWQAGDPARGAEAIDSAPSDHVGGGRRVLEPTTATGTRS